MLSLWTRADELIRVYSLSEHFYEKLPDCSYATPSSDSGARRAYQQAFKEGSHVPCFFPDSFADF